MTTVDQADMRALGSGETVCASRSCLALGSEVPASRINNALRGFSCRGRTALPIEHSRALCAIASGSFGWLGLDYAKGFTSRAIAHTKPESSRAIATITLLR